MPKSKTSKKPKHRAAKAAVKAPLKKSPTKSLQTSQSLEKRLPLPSGIKIIKSSAQLLRQNWRLFLRITLIYGLLTVVLVRGVGGTLNLSDLKSSLKSGFSGSLSSLLTGATLFSYLLGSAGASSNPSGGAYQTLLVIIMSLVAIWALRQVLAGHKIRARDAFYKGTYPLVPFILVLLVVGLQLLPLLAGSWLYSTVVGNALAVTALEKLIWGVIALSLAIFSLYMISSSLFALYIVTLPEMTPMKALRSARQLVRHRRWTILRKIMFLPLALLVIGAVVMIPLILILTPAAEWIFFILSMFVLIVVHTYMYTLYRELL